MPGANPPTRNWALELSPKAYKCFDTFDMQTDGAVSYKSKSGLAMDEAYKPGR